MLNSIKYLKAKKVIYIGLIFNISLLISGCETIGKVAEMVEVLSDPKAALEGKVGAASTVDLIVNAHEIININAENEATPVSFVVVQVRSDAALMEGDFESLTGDIEKALGKSYIDHEEDSVEPGKFTKVGPITLDKKAKFLGILASYRTIDATLWRAVAKLDSQGREYTMVSNFKKDEITLEIQE